MRMTPLFVCIILSVYPLSLFCGASDSVPNRRAASGKFPLSVSEKALRFFKNAGLRWKKCRPAIRATPQDRVKNSCIVS